MHPSFFDDKDYLFTAIAPTLDVNYLASTALKNKVTQTTFSALTIPYTRSQDPPPMMSSTLRPTVTTSEIKMTGNRLRPATSVSTTTVGNDGDNIDLLRKHNEQVRPQLDTGYQPPLDATAQIAAALD